MTQDGGWSGFSDEDLRRLKGSDGAPTRGQNIRRGGQMRRGAKAGNNQSPCTESILPTQMLSKPPTLTTDAHTDFNQRVVAKPPQGSTNASEVSPKTSTEKELSSDLSSTSGHKAVKSEEEKKDSIVESAGSRGDIGNSMKTKEDADLENLVLDESKILSMELINMDKFREQQKMMEELNKKKKAMLTVAIQERQKKAKVEAVKLTRIKQELDKLDQMVVADITVIRNKIEESSREYLEAQKRYDRAEKEFIEAKIDMHKKDDMKTQLTEHLYTIIHQNELRKAKKLTELMEKLEMEESDGELSELGESVHMPAVCLISPVEKRKGCLQGILAPVVSEEDGRPSLDGDGINVDSEAKPSQSENKLQRVNSAKSSSTVETSSATFPLSILHKDPNAELLNMSAGSSASEGSVAAATTAEMSTAPINMESVAPEENKDKLSEPQ